MAFAIGPCRDAHRRRRKSVNRRHHSSSATFPDRPSIDEELLRILAGGCSRIGRGRRLIRDTLCPTQGENQFDLAHCLARLFRDLHFGHSRVGQAVDVGMGTVFLFLVVLVLIMMGMGAFFQKHAHLFKEAEPQARPSSGTAAGDDAELAVAIAAVHALTSTN